jgi:hypothetical protein
MATRKLSFMSTGSRQSDLVDEMMILYVTWREDASAVGEAYRHWSAAPASEEAWRFSAYLASLESEEASAERYARAVTSVGRSLDPGASTRRR